MGMQGYMAPEVERAEEATPADAYSLGSVVGEASSPRRLVGIVRRERRT